MNDSRQATLPEHASVCYCRHLSPSTISLFPPLSVSQGEESKGVARGKGKTSTVVAVILFGVGPQNHDNKSAGVARWKMDFSLQNDCHACIARAGRARAYSTMGPGSTHLNEQTPHAQRPIKRAKMGGTQYKAS
jgi:hypothetical protein